MLALEHLTLSGPGIGKGKYIQHLVTVAVLSPITLSPTWDRRLSVLFGSFQGT